MAGRKIRDITEASTFLDAAEASHMTRAQWARANGIDGRSLNAWYLNLRSRPRAPTTLRVVELVPKLRYASLFAGSPEGGHRWATLLGVVRTAQKCDVDVFGYLTWMFERRGSHRKRFGMSAAELTPLAYREHGCPGAVAA